MKNKSKQWFYQLVVMGVLFVLTIGCKKKANEYSENGQEIPPVTTNAVTGITETTAISGGNVIQAPAYTRGVCWSQSQNPTFSDIYTIDGTGTGIFTSNLTGLSPNTLYYVRAYSEGNGFGNQVSFTSAGTGMVPHITTNPYMDITKTTATAGGNITYGGDSPVTGRGVCWSKSQSPTLVDYHTSDGNGIGNFISKLTGLKPNTPYYIRSYATNSSGTAFGNQMTFTTKDTIPCCPGLPTVTYEGKVYHTVQIGSQCWFKENLNVGTQTQYQSNNGIIEKFCIDSSEAKCDEYGGFYTWDEMMQYVRTPGVRGICPVDWHIPTDSEWLVLVSYLNSAPGRKMKEAGTMHWGQYFIDATNESGFTALPGYNNGTAYFWSSSEHDSDAAWHVMLSADNDEAAFDYYHVFHSGMITIYYGCPKYSGLSVRCIKD